MKDALTTAVELEAFQTANIQRSQANRAVVPHAQTAAAASPEDEKYMPGHLEKKLDTMAKLLQSLVSSLTNPKRPEPGTTATEQAPPDPLTSEHNKQRKGLFVKGSIGGVQTNFLVDIGSNSTIVMPEVYQKIPELVRPDLEDVVSSILLADGHQLPFVGKAAITVQLGRIEVLHEVWIADIGLERILGMDFM